MICENNEAFAVENWIRCGEVILILFALAVSRSHRTCSHRTRHQLTINESALISVQEHNDDLLIMLTN